MKTPDNPSKHLAKRLIEQAVDLYYTECNWFTDNDKKHIAKEIYGKYLVGIISLQDIKEQLEIERNKQEISQYEKH